MKNSKFNKEIDQRLNDPNWEKRMAERVFSSQSEFQETILPANNERSPVYLKLVAACFLFAFGTGIWLYGNRSHSDENRISGSHKNLLNPYDIESGDLLWENEEDDSKYLLGFLGE
ncbi:hypothetical protein [Leptospira idonii]|uniref:Uncharacterized protein n=1 Tax=Leptospira idonii TaxID=1193500 RepID=A0A4R9LZX8_9LEPT|nr:hypothetical protein [Leptospira idonii]TGN19065.1 hypothetical protein EHS15_11705 [Leptospira idonii]